MSNSIKLVTMSALFALASAAVAQTPPPGKSLSHDRRVQFGRCVRLTGIEPGVFAGA